jgi:hypothetical protein
LASYRCTWISGSVECVQLAAPWIHVTFSSGNVISLSLRLYCLAGHACVSASNALSHCGPLPVSWSPPSSSRFAPSAVSAEPPEALRVVEAKAPKRERPVELEPVWRPPLQAAPLLLLDPEHDEGLCVMRTGAGEWTLQPRNAVYSHGNGSGTRQSSCRKKLQIHAAPWPILSASPPLPTYWATTRLVAGSI